jgi:sugar/nucleoside kinase (ribokinase family)
VKLTEVELEFITGMDNLGGGSDEILKYGPRMVFVTRGKDPCFFNNGDTAFEYPTFEMELVDVTGAGDAFMGGTLLKLHDRLSSGMPVFSLGREEIEPILRFATACGAITVTRKGVVPALPTFNEVQDFLSGY